MDVAAIAQPLHDLLKLEEEAELEAARALAAREMEEEEARKHAEAAAAAALKSAQDKAAGEKEAKRRLAEAQNGNEVVGDAEEGHVPKVAEEERVSEEEGDTNAGVTQTAANGGGAEETELL